MDLLEYPRPRNDNGRGVHWFPTLGQRRAVVDEYLPILVDLKMRWLVLWNGLDEAALLANDYLVRRLVSAGITPIVHVYLRPIAPLDDAALIRLHRLVAFYRDPQRRVDYFQLFYEPNVAGEWVGGQMPANVASGFLDAWIPAAQEVINAGGLPGFAPLWPGGDYDDIRFLEESLQGIQDRGHGSVLDRAWIALHNYNLGRGIGEADDAGGFHRYAWVDRVVRQHVGRALPLLTTEGGTRAGESPYGEGADDQAVSADTVAAYEFMKTAPDNYLCYCPWLLGNLMGGGDDPGWEPMAWFQGDGERPVAAAVRGLDDSIRMVGPTAEASEADGAEGGREKLFEDTGHWIRGPFLEFFTRHGLDLCGAPLGEAAVENGLPTQYFQKVVLEEYWPGRIRLRPAGEELVDLHVQVAQAHGQVEPLQRQISELQERLRQSAQATPMSAASAGAAALSVEASALSERLAAAEYEVKRLRDRNLSLEGLVSAPQMAANTGELASIAAAEMYKLQHRVSDLQALLDEATALSAQAITDKARVAAQLDDLQGRIANGEAYALASREALEVTEMVKELEANLAAAETRLQQQSDKQAADEEHIRQLEQSKSQAEERATSCEGQAADLRQRLSELEAQAADAQEQVARLESEKTALAGQMADVQMRLQKAEEMPPGVSVHLLQDRITQLEVALADSQTAVQAMMADKPMISQVMEKWKSSQQTLGSGAEMARLQARADELERDADEARNEAVGLQQALTAAQDQLLEMQRAAANTVAEGPAPVEQPSRVAEMDAFVEKIQAEMRRLMEQNKQLSGHVAELEAAARRQG